MIVCGEKFLNATAEGVGDPLFHLHWSAAASADDCLEVRAAYAGRLRNLVGGDVVPQPGLRKRESEFSVPAFGNARGWYGVCKSIWHTTECKHTLRRVTACKWRCFRK